MLRRFAPLALAAFLFSLASARAAAPVEIGIQGRLEDSAGDPITDPTTVTVRVFDALTAGNLLHTEVENVVPDGDGVFAATLGDGPVLDPADFGQALFAEFEIDGGGPLSPRLALAGGPFAVRAHRAEGLTPTGDLALGGVRITGLSTPVAGDDAANRDYVDATDALLDTAITDLGVSLTDLTSDVEDAETGISGLTTSVALNQLQIGSLPSLSTTTKGSLVEAINEIADLHFTRVVGVPAQGTGTENGGALLAALAGITDATSTNPVLVQLGPGNFNVAGAGALTLGNDIYLRGAGPGVTTITAAYGLSSTAATLEITCIRCGVTDMTIESSGAGSNALGIYITGTGTPRLRRLEIVAGRPTDPAPATGSSYGIRMNSIVARLDIRDSVISVFGASIARGIQSISKLGGSAIRNVEISAESIGSAATGIYLDGDGTNTAPDRIDGAVIDAFSHTSNAFGILVRDVPGVEIRSSSAWASTTGTGFAVGIQAEMACRLADLHLETSAPSNYSNPLFVPGGSTGILVLDSTLRASGGALAQAVRAQGTSESRLLGSVLDGDADAVFVDATGEVFVGSSQMINGTAGAGTVTCYGAYDVNFANGVGVGSCP